MFTLVSVCKGYVMVIFSKHCCYCISVQKIKTAVLLILAVLVILHFTHISSVYYIWFNNKHHLSVSSSLIIPKKYEICTHTSIMNNEKHVKKQICKM